MHAPPDRLAVNTSPARMRPARFSSSSLSSTYSNPQPQTLLRSRLHSPQLHPIYKAALTANPVPLRCLPGNCTVRGSRPLSLVLTRSIPRTSFCTQHAPLTVNLSCLSSAEPGNSASLPLPMHPMHQGPWRPWLTGPGGAENPPARAVVQRRRGKKQKGEGTDEATSNVSELANAAAQLQ